MAQEKPNRLVEWLLLLRSQIPIMRDRAADWLDAVKAEPILIWQTPAVRYATYGVGGVVLVWIAVSAANLFVFAPPVGAKPEATTADFHVVCSNPGCGAHFVTHREFGFGKFPVECPRCERETGIAARPCPSPTCRGRWVAPMTVDGKLQCPRCGKPLE